MLRIGKPYPRTERRKDYGIFPLVIENREEIKDWISSKFKRKEVKPTLSEEEEDDWGV